MSNLLEFYGRECPHCLKIKPLLERLEKETGVKVESYEVWYNEENSAKMQGYDRGFCGGVPFLYNTETDEWLCGEASYEEIKKWANK